MQGKITFLILFLNICCYAQHPMDFIKQVDEPASFTLRLDEIQSKLNGSKDDNFLIFQGFYFDTPKMHQMSIYSCLPAYDPNLISVQFQVYNGELNSFPLQIHKQNNVKKTDLKHSSLYFFTKESSQISGKLQGKENELSFSYETYGNINIYKLEYISSQEEFCFRMNQIYSYIEKELENIKKLENQKQPPKTHFSIGLNSAFGAWSNRESFLNENLSSSRSISPSFFELGITTRLNINKCFFINLDLTQSKFGITTTIEDGQYTIPIEHDFLNERIVSFDNVKEGASFNLNSFGLGAGYTQNFDNNPSFSLSLYCNARYYLPSTFSSKLISGNFSYRGKSPFISQELENINDLNLANNIHYSSFGSSTSNISGFGFSPSLKLNYAISNFNFYTSLNYLLNFWTIQNPMNAMYISPSANEYNSTFMLSERIQNSILSLSFGISYSIK
jgi:hypothetical protein